MDILHADEFDSAYNTIENEGRDLNLQSMIGQLKDIIVNAYDGTSIADYKINWTRSIVKYLKAKIIDYSQNRKPNWETISNMMIDRFAQNGYHFNARTKSASSVSGSAFDSGSAFTSSIAATDTSSSDSASVKILKLNEVDKRKIQALYDALEMEKMWTLSTGTVVEMQMKKLALSRQYEHLAHSMILDVKDTCWSSYFTEAELMEIKEYNAVSLPEIPRDAKKYMNELEVASNGDLYNKVNGTQFEVDTDCKWIQDSYNNCFRLIKSGFFPLHEVTEQGLVKRVWSCVDACYDFSTVKCISGEKCSKASADAANMNRSISDLSRQQSGRKMDYIFKTRDESLEIGCGECALVGGVNTTKELSDASFKMPKVMKDMMYKIVTQSPVVKHEMVITGIYIGEERLKLFKLDCPRGYVTRYDAFNPVMYPVNASKIQRRLAAVLQIILHGRLIMEDMKKKLDESEVYWSQDTQTDIQPSFMPNVLNNKKRKL